VLEPIEAASIELVRLINHAHHQLRVAGMDQLWDIMSHLDLVDDLVLIGQRFNYDRRAWLAASKKLLQGAALVGHPCCTHASTGGIFARAWA
jgi:hypothetical protein